MKKIISLTFLIIVSLTIKSQVQKFDTEHFNVKYELETRQYVDASLKVLEIAWEVATNNGYKLPDKLNFSVIKTDRTVLYFERKKLNGIVLEYNSLDMFLSPNEGGKNNIYGLCHEIGHLSMHRTISNNNKWMSYDFRESWADFFGNIVIDSVYQELGNNFWPVSYNYLDFSGTDFMNKRILEENPKLLKFNIATQFWIELNEKIGFSKMNEFFAQLKKEDVKNPEAKQKFLNVLISYTGDKDIGKWFGDYVDYLILSDENGN